jgi:hypothetical protein
MEEDFVVVHLPKEDYEVLKELIKEREAYNYLTYKIKSLWIWAVVSGIISLFIFWDYVKELFVKV